jgi:hypothetical protein
MGYSSYQEQKGDAGQKVATQFRNLFQKLSNSIIGGLVNTKKRCPMACRYDCVSDHWQETVDGKFSRASRIS